MSQPKIKICGLRERVHLDAACAGGADYVGLVFVEKSPRAMAVDAAAELVTAMRQQGVDHVDVVGLFVNESIDNVLKVVDAVGLDVVQLHGEESPADVAALQMKRPGLRVFKAVPAKQEAIEAWRGLNSFDPRVQLEALLIDTPRTSADALTGGSGEAFDWSMLAALDRDGLPPIMLAGGLTPKNVGEAIEVTQPWGVDVSSGVERERGVKDEALIRAFCEAAQSE